jgi:hypothetical protein
MNSIFRQNERILGQAIFAAKCSVITRYPTDDYYYGPAVLYTLFGDPALRIKMPLPTSADERRSLPISDNLNVAPNPMRGTAVVSYVLTGPAHVNLRLYDARGALVRILAAGEGQAGRHSVGFSPTGLPSGVYFVDFTTTSRSTPGDRLTRKLTIE